MAFGGAVVPLALLLAGCGNRTTDASQGETENTSIEVVDVAPMPTPAPSTIRPHHARRETRATPGVEGDGLVPVGTPTPAVTDPGTPWCAAADDNVSPADCTRLTDFVQHLKIGEAGINAPAAMYVGDTDQLTFAITNDPKANPVSDVLGSQPTQEMPVKVTRRMAAELTGVGFGITPTGNQARDLSATGGAFWSWTIAAQPGANHKLDLSVYVNSAAANAPPELHLVRVLHKDIKVKVRLGDRLDTDLKSATDRSNALSTLLKALLGLVVAAGALWAGIRAFGKKPEKGESGDPPAR